MTPINDIPGVMSAIQTFATLYGSKIPTSVQSTALSGNPQQSFIDAGCHGSPVVRIVDTAEALYAYHAEITDLGAKQAAMTLAAQCAVFAAQPGNQWHGMDAPISTASGAPGRGVGICWAMQRELGETAPVGTSWPEATNDPAIDPRFAAVSAGLAPIAP